jgi:hypothetical protein
MINLWFYVSENEWAVPASQNSTLYKSVESVVDNKGK